MFYENSPDKLEKIRILQQIGDIGIQSAANAFSVLMQEEILLDTTTAQYIAFSDLPDNLGSPDKPIVCVQIEITGGYAGKAILVFDLLQASHIAKHLNGTCRLPDSQISITSFSELDQSAFMEISNILISAFLPPISAITGQPAVPSVPSICIDMAAALWQTIMNNSDIEQDSCLFFSTNMRYSDNHAACKLFLVPCIPVSP